MVKDSAKKALEAGAISVSAHKQWINPKMNCIIPQFVTPVAQEGSLLSLEEVRKRLTEQEKIINFSIKPSTTEITVVFDYEAKEIISPNGKPAGNIPVGTFHYPFRDASVLDVLAVEMLPLEWKQLVYLVYGIGHYTKLEYQGDKGPKPVEGEKTPPSATLPKSSETPKSDSKPVDEKTVEETVPEIADVRDIGTHYEGNKIIHVCESGDEIVRYKKKPKRVGSKCHYAKKRNKKRAAAAAAHEDRMKAYKTKKQAIKKANKERKYKAPSYTYGTVPGKIQTPDKDWCASTRKHRQPRNKKIRVKHLTKGPGLPRPEIKAGKQTQLKAYWKKVELELGLIKYREKFKVDKKNYSSSPNLMSSLYAYLRLNFDALAGATDAQLFEMRENGKLNYYINVINSRFNQTFKTVERQPKQRKYVKDSKTETLACVTDGKTIYRLPYSKCLKVVDLDEKYKFVSKQEWKKAKLEDGKTSYIFDVLTPEERRLQAAKQRKPKSPRLKKSTHRVALGDNGVRKSAINNKNNQPCE